MAVDRPARVEVRILAGRSPVASGVDMPVASADDIVPPVLRALKLDQRGNQEFLDRHPRCRVGRGAAVWHRWCSCSRHLAALTRKVEAALETGTAATEAVAESAVLCQATRVAVKTPHALAAPTALAREPVVAPASGEGPPALKPRVRPPTPVGSTGHARSAATVTRVSATASGEGARALKTRAHTTTTAGSTGHARSAAAATSVTATRGGRGTLANSERAAARRVRLPRTQTGTVAAATKLSKELAPRNADPATPVGQKSRHSRARLMATA